MSVSSLPHETRRGLWSISIGFYLKDGKRTQRKHWLGRDKASAQRKARSLHTAWENETAVDGEGRKVWTQANIDAALNFAEAKPTPAPTAAAAVQVFPAEVFEPTPAKTNLTLEAALDEFNKYCASRGDIGKRHKRGIESHLKSIKDRLHEITLNGSSLKGKPLSAINAQWLKAIRAYITNRPKTKVSGEQISLETVQHWLMHLSTAFAYFNQLGWWQAYPEWRKEFGLTKATRRTIAGGAYARKKILPCFTVNELSQIFKCGTPLERRYLLMGLLLGWAQEGIDSFMKEHFVKRGDQYFIERPRGKTGVWGEWWVAPELAATLEKAIAQTPANKHGLAFVNDHGEAINTRTDSVRLTWDRAVNRAPIGVRKLPFGRVKKRGAQLVQDISGSPALGQLFLAHTPKTVAEEHYIDPDPILNDVKNVDLGKSQFERLHDTQREIWKRIKPLFFPAKLNSLKTRKGNW